MLLQSSSSSFLSSNPGILFPTFQIPCRLPKLQTCLRFSPLKTRASLDEKDPNSQAASLLFQNDEQNKQLNQEVEESVRVLKNAAKTRKVPAAEIMAAFSTIERAKVDPSKFLETLGGTKSPGRTWMLVFTAEKGLGRGRYFPITAIQRFDAASYLGTLCCREVAGVRWN